MLASMRSPSTECAAELGREASWFAPGACVPDLWRSESRSATDRRASRCVPPPPSGITCTETPYRRCSVSARMTARGAPISSTRPSSSSNARRAHRNAWSGSWLENRIEIPVAASAEIRRSTRTWLPKSRLAVGSSSTSSFGSCASARATSASWRSPPEISVTGLSPRCAIPSDSSARSATAGRLFLPGTKKRPDAPCVPSARIRAPCKAK